MTKLDLSPQKTASLVTFLLDRSGSMLDCLGATLEGFNAYVSKLKEEKEAQIDFTFIQFDSYRDRERLSTDNLSLKAVCLQVPISKVERLTRENYVPRGGTPLIDAAYEVIEATIAAVAKRTDNPRVVICIQTDGQENESRKHTWLQLKSLISAQREKGWEFNFMGAGIDAYQQAHLMGIHATNTVSYNKGCVVNTVQAFSATANLQSDFSAGRVGSTAYSTAQRKAAGDEYADKAGL